MICRTAAELMSRELDAPLTAGERVGLRVHTLVCGPCRRYRVQLREMDAAAAADPPDAGPGLPDAARERITESLSNPDQP